MLSFKLIHSGIIYYLFLSIVMEFSDDGDLYQKIVHHEKSNTSFSEE